MDVRTGARSSRMFAAGRLPSATVVNLTSKSKSATRGPALRPSGSCGAPARLRQLCDRLQRRLPLPGHAPSWRGSFRRCCRGTVGSGCDSRPRVLAASRPARDRAGTPLGRQSFRLCCRHRGVATSPDVSGRSATRPDARDAPLALFVTSSPRACELPPVLSVNGCVRSSPAAAMFMADVSNAAAAMEAVMFMIFLRSFQADTATGPATSCAGATRTRPCGLLRPGEPGRSARMGLPRHHICAFFSWCTPAATLA